MASNKINFKGVAIVGPTAVGKTDLAIYLAKKFNGEIIVADSRQIRRELDIGTAKPTKEQLTEVKHYLINEIQANSIYNVALFKQAALAALDTIKKNNRLPILVGGSGLYIDAIIYNFSFRQNTSNLAREYLNSLTLTELQSMLDGRNIKISSQDYKNKVRLIRHIETGGEIKNIKQTEWLIIGLSIDKAEFILRAKDRLDQMLDNGLLNEVVNLANKYGWSSEALNNIGYIEWMDYYNNLSNLEATKQKIITNNWRLAKKQLTWFKRNNSIKWFNYPYNYSLIVDLITSYINQ